MSSPLYFVTSNSYKFAEFHRLFRAHSIELQQVDLAIAEIQDLDIHEIVRHKVVKAYERLGRPLMVDHSGLAMSALDGLPQGLNKQFWEVLQGRVCELATMAGDPAAEIIVVLGVCDGRRVHVVEHREPGTMAAVPAATGTFHLDRVFVPRGAISTLAEMPEPERDKWSHRSKVTDKAIAMLRGTSLGFDIGIRP